MLPLSSRMPTFCNHVVTVCNLVSDEQVIGTDTDRVVALVAHKESFRWNRVVGDAPGNTMRSEARCAPLECDLEASVFGVRPVCASAGNSGPRTAPTIVFFSDEKPKLLNKGLIGKLRCDDVVVTHVDLLRIGVPGSGRGVGAPVGSAHSTYRMDL